LSFWPAFLVLSCPVFLEEHFCFRGPIIPAASLGTFPCASSLLHSVQNTHEIVLYICTNPNKFQWNSGPEWRWLPGLIQRSPGRDWNAELRLGRGWGWEKGGCIGSVRAVMSVWTNPLKTPLVWRVSQVLVAHTCNLSYSGSRHQEDHGSKPALSKYF
jgi:hypothetical protein